MKPIFLFCFTVASTASAAQDSINPYVIQQHCNIILQNTDVYYNPFAPPGPLDTRLNLCNESDQLRDSDGIGNQWRDYLPMVYNTTAGADTFVLLQNWAPWGTPIGQFATWQRLFQAMNKPDGSPSDIIAGSNVTTPDTTIYPGLNGSPPDTVITNTPSGPVIISANEDVDFRATGRIKLKSGFHVKPGAFFHAYTEPKWDTAVFSDEFDDTAKFRNQWHVNNVAGDYYGIPADCNSDSNAYLDTDYQAHDGHALDIILRETLPDTCSCFVQGGAFPDSCESFRDPTDTIPIKRIFSTAILRACPFPDS